ncbi:prephenate dehydratase [Novipirellula artificiosorum]|uniref:prephenate dehydratase n=1 Tax=Novipirellula artificiosorum TaxID=2528016 RepID=A0A5C6E4A2_9BACT|nr:prephenate dehydratase [Novipirellula artificiosorum]TWU42817.1 Prephenate dehydratase [Novipirellula artificiosorum]
MNLPTDRIREIDSQILRLIESRAAEVDGVSGMAMDPNEAALGRVAAAARDIDATVAANTLKSSRIAPSSQAEILKHIASVCLATVTELRVAFLGPKYSYSHLAAIKYFGEGADVAPVGSIAAVFEAVTRGDVTAGLVPIENSTDGRIVDTLGLFIRKQAHICGEVVLPIHHNLLSSSPRESIREIHSKPQVLSQCRKWLASHFPDAKLVESGSSTAAAQWAASQPGAAAVASIEAGRQYRLDVLAANIEDNSNNVTRFAVLGKEHPQRTGDDKTSLLFQVNHQPGALADVMTVFKANRLNLTWIESFPSPDTRAEYLFFVELTGHQDDPAVAAALQTLSQQAQRLEVLGSYPRALD